MDMLPDDSLDFDFTSGENKNTKRKTETDMRIFSAYLISLNEVRPIENLAPIELDQYLTTFFSVIKKHDGNEYEPASLRGMLCSVERYLRSKNYTSSVTRDAIFINTRNMLKEKQKILREISKSQKKTKQDSLTASTVERLKQLYNAKEFGPYSPTAIINSLCFAFVIHLKIRKAVDHKQLLWGDIVLKSNGSNEYLCYEPLQGFDFIRPKLSGISQFRIYAQLPHDSSADPVYIYKLYASKRPYTMMAPDSPFYLGIAVVCNTVSQQQQWFKPSPMGVNKLSDLVRMIRDITGSLSSVSMDKLEMNRETISHEVSDPPYSLLKSKSGTETTETVENTRDDAVNDSTDEEGVTVDKDIMMPGERDNSDMGGRRTYVDKTNDQKDCTLGNDRTSPALNQLDHVKKTIVDGLNLLDEDGKLEILKWFSSLHTKTDEITKKENEKQTFVVQLALTNSQLMSQAPFTVTAEVKKCPCDSDEDLDAEKSTERTALGSEEPREVTQIRLNDLAKCHTLSTSNHRHNAESEQETSINSQRKRTLSEPFPRNAKHLKDQDSRLTPADAGVDDPSRSEKHDEKDTARLPYPVYPFELPGEYASLFPPWTTVDPRLAFFMRHGLIAGYPNLVKMETHNDANKSVE